jgi:rod shape determining protein RodA
MIQPSEFVKITLVCTLAKHLEVVGGDINKPKKLLGVLAHVGVITALILVSGDLGVALVYIGFIAVMLFCAGLSLWYFLGAIVLVGIAVPFLWDFLAPYQRDRIIYGFSPELDPFGYGMQPLMSKEAIARGGMFGEGLFGGEIYETLAASHTDFIFSVCGEEFGLVGCALLLMTLFLIVLRCIWISRHASSPFCAYVCMGMAGMLLAQITFNVGMCLYVLPVMGLTLPFISYGGSSVITLYACMGIVSSVKAKPMPSWLRV